MDLEYVREVDDKSVPHSEKIVRDLAFGCLTHC